jgi:hypothetical protein
LANLEFVDGPVDWHVRQGSEIVLGRLDQVVPNADDDGINVGQLNPAIWESKRVPGRSGKRFSYRVKNGAWVVLQCVAPLSAIERKERS